MRTIVVHKDLMKTAIANLLLLCLGASASADSAAAFARPLPPARRAIVASPSQSAAMNDENAEKFGNDARIESAKALVVGAIVGGLALAPLSGLHDLALGSFSNGYVQNGLAQWEFDTDMGAVQAGLFAVVYRYCVREDENPMLGQGVVGAFVLTRALSRVSVPVYCSAVPLDCGAPLGYLDWNMLTQVAINGVESAALFGVTAAAVEYCFRRDFISKFK